MPEALHLPQRAVHRRLGALEVVLVERHESELGQAERLDRGRPCGAAAGALLQNPSRAVAVSAELAGGAPEQTAERAPRAVLRLEPVGVRGSLGQHRGDVVTAGREHDRETGLQLRGLAWRPPAPARREATAVQCLSWFPSPAVRWAAAAARASAGTSRDLVLREAFEPVQDGRDPAAREVARHVLPQQRPGRLRVARGDRVVDRPVGLVVVGMPAAREPVQLPLPFRLEPPQLVSQRPGEQRVVAVALAGAVERHDEQVRASQVGEQPGGAAALEHGVAGRTRQAVEHGGAHQEVTLLVRDLRQQLVADVLRHHAVAAREGRHGRSGVRLVMKRQGREIEPDGPALGLAHERVHLAGVPGAAPPCRAARPPPSASSRGPGSGPPAAGAALAAARPEAPARNAMRARSATRPAVDPGAEAITSSAAPSPWRCSSSTTSTPGLRSSAAIDAVRQAAPSAPACSATCLNGRGSWSSHCEMRVVLPKPAGATTSASGTWVDSSSRPARRGRATTPGRSCRTWPLRLRASPRARGIAIVAAIRPYRPRCGGP